MEYALETGESGQEYEPHLTLMGFGYIGYKTDRFEIIEPQGIVYTELMKEFAHLISLDDYTLQPAVWLSLVVTRLDPDGSLACNHEIVYAAFEMK